MNPSTGKDTILIVDDNAENLQVLSGILYQHGYNIMLAQHGQEALESVARRQPDLILLDVIMPGMDGFAVCARLKQQTATREIPIIFLTAKTEIADILKGFEIGAVDYITKPFRAPELLARVHTHLTLKHAQELVATQNTLLTEQNRQLERQKAELEEFHRRKEHYLAAALQERMKELQCLYNIGRLVEQATGALPDILQGAVDLIPPAWQHPDFTSARIVLDGQEYVSANFQESAWRQACPIVLHDQSAGVLEVFCTQACPERDQDPFLREEQHLIEAVAERVARIIERIRAEEALRARERQYRALAENVADGIAIIQKGRFSFVNEALCNILKYPAEQLLTMDLMAVFAPREHAQIAQILAHSEHEEFHRDIQALCRTGDGHERWIEECHSLIEWQGMPALIMAIRDIHDRKQHELAVEAERSRLHTMNLALRTSMKDRYKLGDIIGKSLAMQVVYEQILNTSASEASVVIQGESGTGKELVAWTIHRLSARGNHVFAPVNCGAIPEALFESEFFGHRKGAFTGAHQDKRGVLDHARGGTLFLDEVGELAPAIQVKLLRALAGGGYSPLGNHTVKAADVRLITATHRNLTDMVTAGSLREDFFYRIAVVPITLPPLRERKEDIPLLVDHFLQAFAGDDEPVDLPGSVLQKFYDYAWPGNIRELQNALQRYLTTGTIDFIAPRTLPSPPMNADLTPPGIAEHLSLSQAIAAFERQYLLQVLEYHHWHRGKTAAFLGIDPKTLYRKLKQHQVE